MNTEQALAKLFLALLSLPFLWTAHTFVVRCAWNWAVSPVFHFRHCTMLEAFAVVVAVAAILPRRAPDKDSDTSLVYTVSFSMMFYALILAMAAAVGWFATWR